MLVPLLGALTVIAIVTSLVAPTLIGRSRPEPRTNLETTPNHSLKAAVSLPQRASEVVTNANAITAQADKLMETLK